MKPISDKKKSALAKVAAAKERASNMFAFIQLPQRPKLPSITSSDEEDEATHGHVPVESRSTEKLYSSLPRRKSSVDVVLSGSDDSDSHEAYLSPPSTKKTKIVSSQPPYRPCRVNCCT